MYAKTSDRTLGHLCIDVNFFFCSRIERFSAVGNDECHTLSVNRGIDVYHIVRSFRIGIQNHIAHGLFQGQVEIENGFMVGLGLFCHSLYILRQQRNLFDIVVQGEVTRILVRMTQIVDEEHGQVVALWSLADKERNLLFDVRQMVF